MTDSVSYERALKIALFYTIPWFVLNLLIGLVLGIIVFPYIAPIYGGTGLVAGFIPAWVISGIISTFVVWFVWAKFDIPNEYLDKYTK